jgi:hypothetical protein
MTVTQEGTQSWVGSSSFLRHWHKVPRLRSGQPYERRGLRYIYHFEDGGFEIYSGNYFFGPPGHGAFVVGFKAFRWLLNQLGIKQPRRFKNELSTDFTVTTLPRVQDGVDKTPGTQGIDN